ncbi:hypothetical protein [Paenirhodobacter sp.]|uniref:hypothetical protein n=1 Tax=Paenirhodobacter sp. TaxID=1965326 RepID=UPI003B3F97AE
MPPLPSPVTVLESLHYGHCRAFAWWGIPSGAMGSAWRAGLMIETIAAEVEGPRDGLEIGVFAGVGSHCGG